MVGNKEFHSRNKHQGTYDFEKLVKVNPSLKEFVHPGKSDRLSIDFSNPKAVKELNRSLLLSDYKLNEWNIPAGYLCPPVPGRADYIHAVADLLAESYDKNLMNFKVKCLDIGTGANCIYPIIGISEYDWKFIVSETDPKAIKNIEWILSKNHILKDKIEIRKQPNAEKIFQDIINSNDLFDCTICNPPFFSSEEDAIKANTRKSRNLSRDKKAQSNFNFGGIGKELWYKGGEAAFIAKMIRESKQSATNVYWFTSLVSSEKNIPKIIQALKGVKATDFKIIEQNRGNKKSRIVAWTFLNKKLKQIWNKSKK